MDQTFLAYVAGFFDGDGSVMAMIEPFEELKYKFRIRVVMKFAQHNQHRDVLEELKMRVGSGYLTTTASSCEYVLKDQEAIEELLLMIQPYVKVKREAIRLALQLIEKMRSVNSESEFVEAARLADQIAERNLKSKSRRKYTVWSILNPRND